MSGSLLCVTSEGETVVGAHLRQRSPLVCYSSTDVPAAQTTTCTHSRSKPGLTVDSTMYGAFEVKQSSLERPQPRPSPVSRGQLSHQTRNLTWRTTTSHKLPSPSMRTHDSSQVVRQCPGWAADPRRTRHACRIPVAAADFCQ